MRRALALALWAMSACLAAAQNSTVVLWNERPGVGYMPIKLDCNGVARFNWMYKLHELEGTRTPGCKAPAFKNYAKAEDASVSIYYAYPGNYYYKCDIGDHCTKGLQYVTVQVAPKPMMMANVVTWSYRADGSVYAPITVPCGTSLTFVWSTTRGIHDFVQVEKDSCNAAVIKSYGDPVATGNATVTFNKSGTYYYLCSVPGHCTVGMMKVTVFVLPCASDKPPTRRPPPRRQPPPRKALSPPCDKKMLPPGARIHHGN